MSEEGGSRKPHGIIMAEDEPVKVYKRERTIVERVLGKYENGKTKMVTLKQWNKKCGLCVGKQSSAGDTFIYDSGIELPFEVMEELADALSTMSKLANAVNYAELGDNKDSYGNEYRTILKGSEFGGLKICRMKKSPAPIDFAVTTPQEDENVDPSPKASTTTTTEKSPHENWTECWDKFYINRNDDWKKIGNILRDFCCAAHAELNNSQPEGIDIVPPTPPATPSQVVAVKVPLLAVTQKKRKGKETKKTPKKSKISFEEEEEEIICSEVRKKKFFFMTNIEILMADIFFLAKSNNCCHYYSYVIRGGKISDSNRFKTQR
jgi:hypothetical protein